MKSCSEHKTSGGDTYAVVVYEADCGEPCPLCSANKELTDLEDLEDKISALEAELEVSKKKEVER